MSDKVREFVEIPQQFVRDGSQVRLVSPGFPPLRPVLTFLKFLTRCTKPSDKGLFSPGPFGPFSSCHRVHSDLQGRRRWFRRHGVHWLLCQTHPHPDVRYVVPLFKPILILRRNNILVYVYKVLLLVISHSQTVEGHSRVEAVINRMYSKIIVECTSTAIIPLQRVHSNGRGTVYCTLSIAGQGCLSFINRDVPPPK